MFFYKTQEKHIRKDGSFDWDSVISEAKKQEPVENEYLKGSGVLESSGIVWKVYPNGLLLFEGEGKILEEDFMLELDIWISDTSPESVWSWYNGIREPFLIRYIYIPEGITYLGSDAFLCVDFDEIHLPNSLEHIGFGSIYNKKGFLRYLALPEKLKSFDKFFCLEAKVQTLVLPVPEKEMMLQLSDPTAYDMPHLIPESLPKANKIIVRKK